MRLMLWCLIHIYNLQGLTMEEFAFDSNGLEKEYQEFRAADPHEMDLEQIKEWNPFR